MLAPVRIIIYTVQRRKHFIFKEVAPVADQLEKTAVQWHPGFYGAAELELLPYRDMLEFHREYNLSREPQSRKDMI